MALATRKSNPNKPVRILAYGGEGVGKSTLGAKAEKPIFITPEGGTDQLTDSEGNPVEEMFYQAPDGKITPVDTWDKLISSVASLVTSDHDFKTLVLDSADWIEGLAHQHIIGKSGKTITTVDGGYGSGYRKAQNMHQHLIEGLSILRERRNMNIVITAHAHVKAVKDPEMTEDYDAFEIKCHELVSSLWREWVDGLFFIRFRTFIKQGEDTARARALTDGTRVLYTVKQPAFQAKNRYGLPPEMDFTTDFWTEFMKYARKGVQAETAKQIETEIAELYLRLEDQTIKKAVADSMEKAVGDVAALTKIRSRLREVTGAR